MIYLIMVLWTDSMENEVDSAIGYRPECAVATRDQAERIVEAAGVYEGTGWPVSKGETRPMKVWRELPFIESVV